MSQQIKRHLKQSDIVIDPEGNILISYLWDDLRSLNFKNEELNNPIFIRDWTFSKEFTQEDDCTSYPEYRSCKLCPHRCNFDREKNAHHLCGDSSFRVSNVGISYGDEECLTKGGGTGIIMLSGCPLTCPSCHNVEMVRSPGEVVSLKGFLDIAQALYNKGANNLQILSPTVHMPRLEHYLKILKQGSYPLPIVFKSSGYETVEQLKRFEGLVDIYLPDLKFCKNSSLELKANSPDYFSYFQNMLAEMYRQVGRRRFDSELHLISGVLVRYVKRKDAISENEILLNFLSTLSLDVEVSILETFALLE